MAFSSRTPSGDRVLLMTRAEADGMLAMIEVAKAYAKMQPHLFREALGTPKQREAANRAVKALEDVA